MSTLDYLIVGAGFFGSVCARELTNIGKRCIVIDSRNHIGGNCYDIKTPNGVYISTYGGHYGHTNNPRIWNYLNKYSEFYQYSFVAKSYQGGKIYSFPINLMTMQQLWGVQTPKGAKQKLEEVKIKIDNPQNFEEKLLSMVGKEIYEKFFYGYSKRHWGMEPRYVPSSVVERIVVRYNYDDRYFDDTYQYMPLYGYTKLFENLLSGIEVRLNFPFDKSFEDYADKIIYTGCIDEYYNYCFGKLEYRGVYYEHCDMDIGAPMITFPDYESPFNRQFCYNYSSPVKDSENIITHVEYPSWDEDTKYYPINTPKNLDLYKQYASIPNNRVIFGGRLGNYKYINMDKTIEMALDLVRQLCKRT